MLVTITRVLIQHQVANKSRVLINPIHLTDSREDPVSTSRRPARKRPLHFVHGPPLRCEEEDRPGDDPEESEVEDPADPAGAPPVDERGRVDVDCFLVDAEGDVGVAAVMRGSDQILNLAYQAGFIDAFDGAADAEDFELGRRRAEVLAPVFQSACGLV